MTATAEREPPRFALSGQRIWVAGHRGMVGSALVRRLAREDCVVLTAARGEVDLTRQADTEAWLAAQRPDAIILAAARVGGIAANDARPAEFLYENLAIQANVIHAAWTTGVRKLLFLGSSCIYPKFAPQPIGEESLLSGPLEPTNQWYAIAKIAGLKMCAAYRRQHGCNFIAAMPTNLYGPGDNYDLEQAHVVGALLAKVHAAKVTGSPTIEVWGTGTPRREFLFVDDLADACAFLMQRYDGEAPVNVGTGSDVTILELAQTIAAVVGWRGRFVLNASRPDGTPRKLLDVARLAAMGWRASTSLSDGLAKAYEAFLSASTRRGAAGLVASPIHAAPSR